MPNSHLPGVVPTAVISSASIGIHDAVMTIGASSGCASQYATWSGNDAERAQLRQQ